MSSSAFRRYGGFWIRAVAAFLDSMLLLIAIFPIRMLLSSAVTLVGVDSHMSLHDVLQARRWVRLLIGAVIGWVYKAGMESSTYQATLGKMAVHLKVTDLEGGRISFGRATARCFAKYLSLLAFGLGYLMVAFDQQKQALHDRIAGTLVERRISQF